MAVNQPPISDDPVVSAWMLEVTRELNELRNLMMQTTGTTTTTTAPPTTDIGFDRVDISAGSSLRINSRELTGLRATGTGSLEVMNYVQLVSPTDTNYSFQGAGFQPIDIPPNTHTLYLGGQKLIESVDYNLDPDITGRVTLTSLPSGIPSDNLQQGITGIMLELSIWSI